MKNQEFYIESDRMKIHCKLDFPEGTKEGDKLPLMILQHGLHGNMEERHITGIAEYVTGLGFAVLRTELYGHGLSDGEFVDHTVLKWISQMLDVVNYAESLPFVTDLYLAGHSQGGLVAILVGAMNQNRIKALLPLAPATIIPDAANMGQVMDLTFDPKNVPERGEIRKGRILSGNYFRTAQYIQVEDAIRRFEKPVLIVHGDADMAVPVSYAYKAAEGYSNCTLKIIEGDTHCYDHHLDQVNEAIGEFLKSLQ